MSHCVKWLHESANKLDLVIVKVRIFIMSVDLFDSGKFLLSCGI
uniref:Uncharacterized protein n=1 Tax=Rhizophora mucronata TaxID=61149 RepID=A0A2P2NUZ5_RHIMU